MFICFIQSAKLILWLMLPGTFGHTQKRRERLPWFFTANGPNGPEQRKMFRRDPCNDNRKQAIVNAMVQSIESKGLVPDARGKCWLVERPDADSFPGTVHYIFNYFINNDLLVWVTGWVINSFQIVFKLRPYSCLSWGHMSLDCTRSFFCCVRLLVRYF